MADRIYIFDDFIDARGKFISDQTKSKQEILRKEKILTEGINAKLKCGSKEKSNAENESEMETNENNVIYKALEWGLADAGLAVRGKGGTKCNETEEKKAFEEMTEKLQEYFSLDKDQITLGEFDKRHEELCKIWTGKLSDNEHLSTYGMAQKVVNMAFKYLYCCADADNYAKDDNNYFKYCHVPLDTFTLEWFRHEWFFRKTRQDGTPISVESRLPWSTIKDYDTYMTFQNCFREWYENENITPLQAEFIYWPLVK